LALLKRLKPHSNVSEGKALLRWTLADLNRVSAKNLEKKVGDVERQPLGKTT